jgi:rSAM/selenodomain-associated transferase 2
MHEADRAEVIVVDGDEGSTVNALRIQDPRVRRIVSPKGRGVQLNRGARRARGRYLVFLHVDTQLPRDGLRALEDALQTYEAGAFDIRIVSRDLGVKIISITAAIRSRITRIPYGDQTHFIRADTFRRIGGYPDTPIMEDVDLMYRLKRRGIRITILPQCSYTSDRRWSFGGVARNTLHNWKLVFMYTFGAGSAQIAERYRPQAELDRRLLRRRRLGLPEVSRGR